MKTHLVTDNHYSSNEDMYIAFTGTFQECTNYKQEQSEISFADSFMLNVVPMTEKELLQYNPDQQQAIGRSIRDINKSDSEIIDIAFGKSGTPRKEIVVYTDKTEIESNTKNICMVPHEFGSINEMRQSEFKENDDDYNMGIFKNN